MAETLKVDDVPLLPLEGQKFHDEFKRYYQHKRGNFFKAITEFADLWECFQLLNDIWMREMADLKVLRDKDHLLPRMLFTAAHSKFVTALELGFSCCIGDAYSLLRDGIEFTAHAHKIFSEPSVATIWSEKMQGNTQTKGYDKIFTHNKKKNLFPDKFGLRPLHAYYAQLSEIGTHSNTTSLGKASRRRQRRRPSRGAFTTLKRMLVRLPYSSSRCWQFLRTWKRRSSDAIKLG